MTFDLSLHKERLLSLSVFITRPPLPAQKILHRPQTLLEIRPSYLNIDL